MQHRPVAGSGFATAPPASILKTESQQAIRAHIPLVISESDLVDYAFDEK